MNSLNIFDTFELLYRVLNNPFKTFGSLCSFTYTKMVAMNKQIKTLFKPVSFPEYVFYIIYHIIIARYIYGIIRPISLWNIKFRLYTISNEGHL